MKQQNLINASEWFKLNGFTTYQVNDLLYLVLDDIRILISEEEINYRSMLLNNK